MKTLTRTSEVSQRSRCWAITGGTGYIGRYLVGALNATGESVRILTRRAVPEAPGTRIVQGELANLSAVERLVDGADIVVHLASFVHRPASTKSQVAECHTTTVTGTRTVVDAIARVRPDAFLIYVSSSSVYGDLPFAREKDTCRPQTVYGIAKLQAEHIVRSNEAVASTVIRPAMVLGPDAPGNFGKLIRLIDRFAMPDIGARSVYKSLVPVDRLVAALILVADRKNDSVDQVFNVGSGGEILSMFEIGQEIAASLHKRLRTVRLPASLVGAFASVLDPAVLCVRPSAPSVRQLVKTFNTSTVIDDELITKTIGFASPANVRTAIREAVRCYLERELQRSTF